MARTLILALLLLLFGGCRTTAGLLWWADYEMDYPKPPYIYIGTRMDWRIATKEGTYGMLFDLPFSFLLDTIRLPVTISMAMFCPRERLPEFERKRNAPP